MTARILELVRRNDATMPTPAERTRKISWPATENFNIGLLVIGYLSLPWEIISDDLLNNAGSNLVAFHTEPPKPGGLWRREPKRWRESAQSSRELPSLRTTAELGEKS
jgi:hypothetical protein